jgi:glucose/arabinose dehydrogenase
MVPGANITLVVTLQSPVYVANAGDGRIFIVERTGRILVCVAHACTTPTTFLDISSLVDTSGEGGLFSIAFHPNYASNGYFYVSYTDNGGGGPSIRSVIARYQVSEIDPNVADPGSEARLIEIEQPHDGHNNGQLAFSPIDGYLYVGFGDGGGPNGPLCRSQLDAKTLGTDAFHGKILRLDVDQNLHLAPYYGIPAGNPFEGPGDQIKDEIWAKGFRNPWRFSFDWLNGDLWIADVGESASEEINRQSVASPGGENYGWKVMEGTSCHDPDPIDSSCPATTPSCFDASYTPPLFEYDHSLGDCSVTGGYVYRGFSIDGLQGAYLFGDYCTGLVWALEETSPDVWTERQLLNAGSELTSFGENASGEIYLTVADDVYRVVPEPGSLLALSAGIALLAQIYRRRNRL